MFNSSSAIIQGIKSVSRKRSLGLSRTERRGREGNRPNKDAKKNGYNSDAKKDEIETKDILKFITFARLSAVLPTCQYVAYGEGGDVDRAIQRADTSRVNALRLYQFMIKTFNALLVTCNLKPCHRGIYSIPQQQANL
jgi:hypothetical protein